MNDDRFFDLAMKSAAGQSTAAERAELDAILAQQPKRKAEFERFQAEARLAKETLPLVAATEATAGEFPAYARGRLQTKVRQTYGRGEATDAPEAKPNWLWLRWLAFTTVATAIALLAIPTLFRTGHPVIQLALLDTAGPARGGADDESRLLIESWKGAALQSFAKSSEADSWQQAWPSGNNTRVVKVIYDRNAAEVRVVGRWNGKSFQQTFPVEKDLSGVLKQAQAFITQQTK